MLRSRTEFSESDKFGSRLGNEQINIGMNAVLRQMSSTDGLTITLTLKELCMLPTQCICVFHMVLTINSINQLGSVAET
jgi:hypothetical protein